MMSLYYSIPLLVFSCLLFSTRSLGFEVTDLKPCENALLKDCLGKFVQAFSDHDPSMTNLQIHCRADMLLAKCTATYRCNGESVAALSQAILSYLLFDAKLKVCPREPVVYWQLARKSAAGSENGFYEILKIVLARTPRCARTVDISCLKEYVHLMRTNPNLCVNIPKKYECLRKKSHRCRAEILDSLLGVFPSEADKVLHVLCHSVINTIRSP